MRRGCENGTARGDAASRREEKAGLWRSGNEGAAGSRTSGRVNGLRGGACRGRLRDIGGTVLMESILVLPLLLMLITGIFQFARFWQARLLTRYAAFNAARATLVYNPEHYRSGNSFKEGDGVCWQAAVETLAWLSSTPDSDNYWLPGYGSVPHSSRIREQVRIIPKGCTEENGWVKVTVAFYFPTLFAVFDATAMHPDGDGGGKGPAELTDVAKYPHFTFVESCILPKPWTTEMYPTIGKGERAMLASHLGGGS